MAVERIEQHFKSGYRGEAAVALQVKADPPPRSRGSPPLIADDPDVELVIAARDHNLHSDPHTACPA
jgi:hypothetical protein